MIKKGQVTMETIMIYGIVAIVAISGIGALIYFGVLDVQKYLPDKCTLNNVDLQCEQWAMNTQDGIGIGIRNLNKYPIIVSDFEIKTSDESEKLTNGTNAIKSCKSTGLAVTINSNSLESVVANSSVPCYIDPSATTTGEKIKVDYIITYKTDIPSGNSLTQKATGELLATRV